MAATHQYLTAPLLHDRNSSRVPHLRQAKVSIPAAESSEWVKRCSWVNRQSFKRGHAWTALHRDMHIKWTSLLPSIFLFIDATVKKKIITSSTELSLKCHKSNRALRNWRTRIEFVACKISLRICDGCPVELGSKSSSLSLILFSQFRCLFVRNVVT